jgi:NAD(P)-dependent dehydrogenase (short-subunit alcohol dehydrogenase family)
VNLTGTFLGCQVIGKQMLKQGAGSIINLASLYALVSPHHPMYPGTGIVQPVAYSVSKAGVLGLTRYLGTLWAPRGVRVNALTPGGVFSGQRELFVQRFSTLNPMGRMARKDEMRGAIVYLASDASSHCTAQNLIVDGGWTAW